MLRRTFDYQLRSTFFGLTPEYRKAVFDQIDQTVIWTEGAYSFTELYTMPIHLRKYYHKKALDRLKNNAEDNPSDLAEKIKGGRIQIPEHFKGSKVKYNG
jgi:hypothetical protein